jgi:hypothetical protein
LSCAAKKLRSKIQRSKNRGTNEEGACYSHSFRRPAVALAIMTAGPALAFPARPRAATHSTARSILRTGSIVTGVRGSGGRGVVLTGTYLESGGSAAFLWLGPLSHAGGAAVSVLRPRSAA